MRRWWVALCLVAAPAFASPSDGFRAGLRVPVSTGDQRSLVPEVGLGVETRLDMGSQDFPIGFAFICHYDEFFQPVGEAGNDIFGGDLFLGESQSLSYSSFLGAATFRYGKGRLLGHADLGAGISIGFFHGLPLEGDPEVFESEFLLGFSGGGGLSFFVGDKGVIDLSAKYQKLLLNDKTVVRQGDLFQIFDDFYSFGLTAGYLF